MSLKEKTAKVRQQGEDTRPIWRAKREGPLWDVR